jgi:hypothetical protein
VTGVRWSRIFWIGAAAILIVAALIAVAAILRGDFGETEARILGTLLLLLVAGATAISGLALVERGAVVLGYIATGAAGVCFALITWLLWDDSASDSFERWAWSAAPVLVGFLLISTQRLLLRFQRLTVVFYATAVAAGLSIFAIWAEYGDGGAGDGIFQAIAVFWILAALGYLLLPVLQRFTAAGAAETAERVLAQLDGVKLVATRSGEGIEPRLSQGERLALRRG